MVSDAIGNMITKYIYGENVDEPIKMYRNGHDYYYSFDNLGSVISLTDSSGAKVEEYAYDVFGNTTIKDAEGNTLTQSAVGNTFAYTSRELDNETGLYYYRERYYLPELGRFLQTDPLQLDDENTYAYCNNNSPNNTDPYGLIANPIAGEMVFQARDMIGKDISLHGAVPVDFARHVLNGYTNEQAKSQDIDGSTPVIKVEPKTNDLTEKKSISTKGAPKPQNYGNLTLSERVTTHAQGNIFR